jgi:hypothetical protein
MCQHQPRCPEWPAPDHLAARIVADKPSQGWSLLCNGVIEFDDGGELLPDGRAVTPDRRAFVSPRGNRRLSVQATIGTWPHDTPVLMLPLLPGETGDPRRVSAGLLCEPGSGLFGSFDGGPRDGPRATVRCNASHNRQLRRPRPRRRSADTSPGPAGHDALRRERAAPSRPGTGSVAGEAEVRS